MVMRKTWVAKNRTATATPRWLSSTGKIGTREGMKERQAWNTIPSKRANPLTVSRACSHTGGEFVVTRVMGSSLV